MNIFKKISKSSWILLAIILVGVFLRTYHFREWLEFKSDQARDATLVGEVIGGEASWPLLGPTMENSNAANDKKLFSVGPIYYHFQITSAYIFGDYPDKHAYPDLFFSVLVIPLFYLFLKKYFSQDLSLILSGMYTVSFFAIRYSRFAWNSNSIPFFVLLFLLSLHEIIIKKEKTGWRWIVFLGIALGVGVQLHALTMALFPAVAFLIFIFSIKENRRMWKKWAAVLAVCIVLNTGQIISELKTDFSNSKVLVNYFLGDQEDINHQKKSLLINLVNNTECHVEANFHMLTSVGESRCFFYLQELSAEKKSKGFLKDFKNPIFGLASLGGLIFSIFGYGLFGYYFKKEKEERRQFLQLILIYIVTFFLIMLPLSDGQFRESRYFSCVFFVPFIFLGFFLDYLSKKSLFRHQIMTLVLFLFISAFNFMAIFEVTKALLEEGRMNSHSIVLGGIEPVAKYIMTNSERDRRVYLKGDYSLLSFAYNPLAYLVRKNNVDLIKVMNEDGSNLEKSPIFYIGDGTPPKKENYEKYGSIYVYKLK